MSVPMTIHLPDEISHYEGELRYFFDSVVRKLHVNRHRGFANGLTVDDCYDGISHESIELARAIKTNEPQFSAYMEAVDVGAWAFLTAVYIARLTRPEYDSLKDDAHGPA